MRSFQDVLLQEKWNWSSLCLTMSHINDQPCAQQNNCDQEETLSTFEFPMFKFLIFLMINTTCTLGKNT